MSKAKTRITTKQRAARQRNIVIARKAKKRSPSSKKYGKAYAKAYREERKAGMDKRNARSIAAHAASKAAPNVAVKKSGARAKHYALRKGYSKRGAEEMARGARRSARQGGTGWLTKSLRY